MNKINSFLKITSPFFILFILTAVLYCSKKQEINKKSPAVVLEQQGLLESYRKTGWITEEKYRAVVFIITNDECLNTPGPEIEERIKLEAYKQLQKELNPSFSRNASVQIKNIIDRHGSVITAGQSCIESNVYFFDIEKKDLKREFVNIKNLK